MAQVGEAEAQGDVVSPAFELGRVHLDGGAAGTARQVVVVRVIDAAPIERFAPIGHDDVDQLGVRELPQLAIDGGERDFTAIARDQFVQILSADESLDPLEGANDLAALVGVARHGHSSIVVAKDLLTGMIPTNVSRMILEKSPRRLRVRSSVVLLAVGSLALAACSPVHATHGSPGISGSIEVVAAEVQYGDVLAQIGGPYVHVTSIMSNPNTDPHNFEASPSIAQAIASATLIVQNGAGYDSFMNQLESASANTRREVLTIAAMNDQVSAANPHMWYSPSTMPTLAAAAAAYLEKRAPSHASYFRARDAKFLASWIVVSQALATARHLVSSRAVATTEPVGDDLLAAMGLDNVTPFRFQADVMNGIDPSPQDIATQEALLNHHRVGALCFNAQVTSPVTTSLRKLALKDKVPLVAIYETMPTGLHVQSWMLKEINAIEAALREGTSTVSLS